MSNVQIESVIEDRVGDVRIDGLDITFGEILSLIANHEFDIGPDFQRLFRWTTEQRSRLIESVLVGLPIPQIFAIETESGVLELIDGLQRICSMVHFLQPDLINIDELLILEGCDLIQDLNGKSSSDLPLSLRLRLKRTPVRMVVVKRQSTGLLRYSMFKRLNTGGSELSAQEIRNCTSRMVGPEGAKFYDFLRRCAASDSFRYTTETLSSTERDQRGDEELVLRFFALKNGQELFRGHVRDWLDDYMEQVILGKRPFDYDSETAAFDRLFGFIREALGEHAFVKYRGENPIGGLAPAYYEAITVGIYRAIAEAEAKPREVVKTAVVAAVQRAEFRENVGTGANKQTKLAGRVNVIREAVTTAPA